VILVSMLLVLVGFVTLLLGVLGVGERPLDLVWVSIGSCLLAAVLLVAGVMRGRPSRKPVASGGTRGDASWAGASSWGEQREPAASPGPAAAPEPDAAGPVGGVESGDPVVPDAPGGEGQIADQAAWDAFAPPPADGEAARFAAVLGDVNGVGSAERQALRDRFGSVDALRGADRDELLAVDGISEALADRIRRALE
jgi:hypothetical protein